MLQRILHVPFYSKLDDGDYIWRPSFAGKGYRFRASEAEPVIFFTRTMIILFFGLFLYMGASDAAFVPEGMEFETAQELVGYKFNKFFFIFIFFAVINAIIYFRLFVLARSRGADTKLSTSLLGEVKGVFHLYIQMVKLMFKVFIYGNILAIIYAVFMGLEMYYSGIKEGLVVSGGALFILLFIYLGWSFIKAGKNNAPK